MKTAISFLIITSFTLLTLYEPLFAEDKVELLEPLEVKASRSNLKEDELPSSITVITREEIERKQIPQVKDLLREVLGIDVLQTGPLGSQTSIFMRGNGSGATLVLIDGVQVNSNTVGAFDFANLPTESIESIEIIRGPQSTLWGADAMGGVINIVTRKGRGKPSHFLSVEGGSFVTFKETAGSSGAIGDFDYSVTISRTDSQGFSSADESNGNPENDGFNSTTLSSRFGLNFLDDGRIDLIGHYSNSTNDLDIGFDFANSVVADGPEFSDKEYYQISLPIKKSITDWWDVKLTPSYYYHEAETLNAFFESHIINKTYTVDLQNNLTLGDYFTVVFGGEYQNQKGNNITDGFSPSIVNYAMFLQTILNYDDRLVLTAGFRSDFNDTFGNNATYKFEGAYKFEQTGTRIRAAYATGFRAPTINDLFFPSFEIFGFPDPFLSSNPDLKPEKSRSWEIGIDQTFLDGVIKVGTTYFDSDIENLIQSDPTVLFPDPTTFQLQNIANAASRGTETYLKVNLENIGLTLTHTWNEALDENGAQLLRRARSKFSANLHHTWAKFKTLIGVTYKSGVNDTSARKISGYKTVRAAMEYRVLENLKITARGENLFDENYQEVTGFGTAGISGYLGLTWNIN